MEQHELLRRAEDLYERCQRGGTLTHTLFLSPAEQAAVELWARRQGASLLLHGGHEQCERKLAVFLPDWMPAEDFDPAELFRCIGLTAHFGQPGHRDYLGALLGMGVGREWLGDIWISGSEATVFCLPSVERHLLSIDKVGRNSVTARALTLDALQPPERKVKALSFTVMSLRLDAVTAGMFRLSRSEAARQIALGNVSLNYIQTEKTDAPVREGDILSLRGAGKGRVTEIGGNSRKGRVFVYTEIYQ